MRPSLRLVSFAFLAMLLGVIGCQRLNIEKKYTLSPGRSEIILISAPPREQSLTVSFKATSPVDLYVATENDATDANDRVSPPKSSFGSSVGRDSGVVTATIPAKTAYGVVLLNAKRANTEITVNIKGK